jgi:hypothetical protein
MIAGILTKEFNMKNILSGTAAALPLAGVSAGAAQAKHRHYHMRGMHRGMGMSKGMTPMRNGANGMSGKNSPASLRMGSVSPAGGGER